MADEKNEAPEAFQKFLRASQACLPASNVARGRHTLSPTVLRAARAGRTYNALQSEIEVGPLGRGAVTMCTKLILCYALQKHADIYTHEYGYVIIRIYQDILI